MNDIMPEGYLSYSGPFNLTIDEIYMNMYFGSDPWYDSVYYANDPTCTPVDGITQQITLTNAHLKSPIGNHEFKFIQSMSLIADDIGDSRPFVFIVDNYFVQDIQN